MNICTFLNNKSNLSGANHYMSAFFLSYAHHAIPTETPSQRNFRQHVEEFDLDLKVLQDIYGPRDRRVTINPAFEESLERIFPLNAVVYPGITLPSRLEYIRRERQRYVSPQNLAFFLDMDSLEDAYPRLDDSLKRDFLRVALNQWAYCSGWTRTSRQSTEWEKTFQALFAAGADFEVFRGQDIAEHPGLPAFGNPADAVVVELMRHFVGPYAWANAGRRRPVGARDALKGFGYLISQTESFGIKLKTTPSCRRLQIRFDDFWVWPYGVSRCLDTLMNPQTLDVYYDDDLSTWVMWHSVYEEYCGEFWDVLDRQLDRQLNSQLNRPERMMPGAWID